jgi:hypothetical protein
MVEILLPIAYQSWQAFVIHPFWGALIDFCLKSSECRLSWPTKCAQLCSQTGRIQLQLQPA